MLRRTMPGPMRDCYVLARDRSARGALSFLETFVPAREPCWDPADPAEVLGGATGCSFEDILGFLERHPDRDYSVYLRNTESRSPYFAILAYRGDGSLILGLSGDEEEEGEARALVSRLEDFAGSVGYWSVEEPPALGRHDLWYRAETYRR